MTLTTELRTLSDCEQIIEAGLTTFVEVGRALLLISDERLYKATHSSFEEYCTQRWDMTARHAYRLCDAAKSVDVVSESATPGSQSLPTSEKQIRPIVHETPEVQRAAWKEATKETPNPTARQVLESLKKVTAKPQVEPAASQAKVIDHEFQVWLRMTLKKASDFIKKNQADDIVVMELEGVIASMKLIIERTE